MPKASSGMVSGGTIKQGGGPGGPVERTISVTFDGGGAELLTGLKAVGPVLENGTLTGWTLYAEISGSLVVDIWVTAQGDYDPEDADSITGSNPPSLSMEQFAEDTVLTGWEKALTKGGVIGFNIDSVSGIDKALLVLTYMPS